MFAIWISVAAALVGFAVWYTKSAYPLWLMAPFFLIRIKMDGGTGADGNG